MFYHGTSDVFNLSIGSKILPSIETGILREEFRKVRLNIVFITTSKYSAFKYAKRASEKFGGNPIVYEVKGYNISKIQNTEYACDFAKIIQKTQ